MTKSSRVLLRDGLQSIVFTANEMLWNDRMWTKVSWRYMYVIEKHACFGMAILSELSWRSASLNSVGRKNN